MIHPAGKYDRWTWIGGAALILLTFLAFVPILKAGFINFDDDGYVYDNPHVAAGLTLANIRWALTSTDFFNWHPLTWISLMLDATIWGLNPRGFHLTNLLMHLGNALLVWWILGKMMDRRLAWAAAAIWAIHPLRVESVGWVSERKDVLSALFGFGAIGCYLRCAAAPTLGRYLSVVALLSLSLASKAMFVTLPMLLMLLDYWPLNRWDRSRWKRVLIEKAPLLLLIVLVTWKAYVAQERSGAVADWVEYNWLARISNALIAYVRYLMRLGRVHDLVLIYPIPDWAQWQVAGATALLAAITGGVFWQIRKRPWMAVGWCWFVGAMVPVIGLVQLGSQSMADRYMYLPMIGLLIALAPSIPLAWLQRSVSRISLAVFTLVLLAYFGVFTWIQCGYWRNTITLFTRSTQLTVGNYIAWNNLGNAHLDAGDVLKAKECYLKVMAIKPNPQTLSNLAYAMLTLGDPQGAIPHLEQAMRVMGSNRTILNNAAMAYFNAGRVGDAHAVLQRIIALFPDQPESYANLGNLYIQTRQWGNAVQAYQKAQSLSPNPNQYRSQLEQAMQAQKQGGGPPNP